jgi:hypothetical protein
LSRLFFLRGCAGGLSTPQSQAESRKTAFAIHVDLPWRIRLALFV